MAAQPDRRPLVMGVLNVTPDSFFDGGCYLDTAEAVARGRQMAAEGADLVDVGGESSRPGADPVDQAEELRRVLPVVEALAGEVRVSVDTAKPDVARAAVAAGATLVNDISGALWPVAAALGVGWVAMHMQGTPQDMQRDPQYGDVVAEVHGAVLAAARNALAAGIPEVWVDPGIGFGKTAAHNLALLAHLAELAAAAADLGAAVLVGTSRKSFLGRLGRAGQEPRAVDDRLEESLATATWALAHGAGMVRVHDVAATVTAAALAAGPAARTAPVAA
ncbi:MAG TPA: dihydropteroate synthase [Acidimicrobiales bacterium]|nr:dihydropteroate synthase [Acidimicrobiales bacterium]